MKLGAIFPTCEIGNDPAAIRDWAQTAEDLGYDHIVIYDHVLGAVHEGRQPALMGPYTEDDPFHEPFVLLAYLAAATTRIGLSTGVLILPQRQTALVAKQAAELDVLSGGRFRLAVGTGWNYVEYESLGASFSDRGRMLDEQVEVLRLLWREKLVDFDGRFHRIDRAGILPQPRPDLPIWFGAYSEPALRRAARIGDGVIFGSGPSAMRPLLRRLHHLVEEEGRDLEAVSAEAVLDYCDAPEHWRSEVEAWREAGGTHLSVRAMDTAAEFVGAKRVGLKGPADHIQALSVFHKELQGD